MNIDEYQNTLCRLNYDYLSLLKNPSVQKALWKNSKHSLVYKLSKLLEITYYLGFRCLKRYICGSKLEMELLAEEHYRERIKDISNKIAVYTCIFGNIDNIIEPLFVNPLIDYFIITDQEIPQESKWKKIDVSKYRELDKFNNQRKNRYCKIFPDKIFPSYDYSIYLDGNILIVADLLPLINRLEDKCIGIFKHPARDDIYVEAAAVIYLGNALGKDVKNQMNSYRRDGFPEEFGLYENSLIVRKHNDFQCKEVMALWWEQVNNYTVRDQLSLMYCLWKKGYNKYFIAELGADIDMCPYIRRVNHKNK